MKRNLRNFILFFAAMGSAYGQDIHWSQPTANLLYLNTAFAGVQNKYSLGINYREQWNMANTSYKTFLASGHYCFGKKADNSGFSLGGIIFKDQVAGGTQISTSGGITLSELLKLNKKSRLGFGIGYNIFQNSVNKNNYTWSRQFDGRGYNSSLSPGEQITESSKIFTDLNAGLTYVYLNDSESENRTEKAFFAIGYSLNHINRPNLSLNGAFDPLLMKHTVVATGLFRLDDNWQLKPAFVIHRQGKMMNIMAGTLFRTHIKSVYWYNYSNNNTFFSLGIFYRYIDAIIPTFEFEKKKMSIGVSYDINISKFSSTSKYKGGLEIYLKLKPGNSAKS